MKLSFKLSTFLFFLLYLLPVMVLGYFTAYRIEQRQVVLQRFLQSQVDVDRQIISQRARFHSVNFKIRAYLLAGKKGEPSPMPIVRDELGKFKDFWKRYEGTYSVKNRPFLQDILERNQEANLISEETEVVSGIHKKADAYITLAASYAPLKDPATAAAAVVVVTDHIPFIFSLDESRDDLYKSFDQLADIRYIFAQRVVFDVSGENERQYGFFVAIFVGLFAAVFVISVLEYFFIHKPFKDIMAFLRDMSQGKRGQRLYFSSPIKEIKESEEIINQFVSKAEEHEKEK